MSNTQQYSSERMPCPVCGKNTFFVALPGRDWGTCHHPECKKSTRIIKGSSSMHRDTYTPYVPPTPNEQTTAKPKEDLGTITEKREHIYYNEDGTDNLTKVDITKYSSGKKTAYQSRWDAKAKKWVSGKGALNGVVTTLYDAPLLKLLQAAPQAEKDSTTVYIVEGEFFSSVFY